MVPEHLAEDRTLVLADDALVRGALERALEAVGVTLARAADDASVVVWDLGPDAGQDRGVIPPPDADDVPLVALTDDLDAAREALAEGARAVLLRDGDPDRLAAAVRAVSLDLRVVDGAFADLLPGSSESAPPSRGFDALTPREQEVLGLLAEGLSNGDIAARLAISPHTVKFHVNAVLAKLDARSRTDAVVRAARQGLLVL